MNNDIYQIYRIKEANVLTNVNGSRPEQSYTSKELASIFLGELIIPIYQSSYLCSHRVLGYWFVSVSLPQKRCSHNSTINLQFDEIVINYSKAESFYSIPTI